MARLGEEAAAILRLAFGELEPVAALLHQPIGAQAAQQHIVGAPVLGVQLEAVALEPLHLHGPALDLLLALGRHREAKHRQPAVLLPELADAAIDALAGLGEAAGRSASRARRGHQAGQQRHGK
jgi:hypothetical protein